MPAASCAALSSRRVAVVSHASRNATFRHRAQARHRSVARSSRRQPRAASRCEPSLLTRLSGSAGPAAIVCLARVGLGAGSERHSRLYVLSLTPRV